VRPTETIAKRSIRCAIYTRKSTEDGLEQEFNSLDAQRECAEAYILSQRAEGWVALADRYDDGGFTGANADRPGLRQLLADVEARQVDCVVVYKVDRLSRSLLDFARLMEVFDKRGATFVSVTQQLNTNSPMGRLTLNVLLSFAQFEREIIGERTRDKKTAARKKGKWMGGCPDQPICSSILNAKSFCRFAGAVTLLVIRRAIWINPTPSGCILATLFPISLRRNEDSSPHMACDHGLRGEGLNEAPANSAFGVSCCCLRQSRPR